MAGARHLHVTVGTCLFFTMGCCGVHLSLSILPRAHASVSKRNPVRLLLRRVWSELRPTTQTTKTHDCIESIHHAFDSVAWPRRTIALVTQWRFIVAVNTNTVAGTPPRFMASTLSRVLVVGVVWAKMSPRPNLLWRNRCFKRNRYCNSVLKRAGRTVLRENSGRADVVRPRFGRSLDAFSSYV